MSIVFSADPANTARRYYESAIATRSVRYNVIYKALYLLEYCCVNGLLIPYDLWRRPEDIIADIIRGLNSGEKNSRRANNHGTADYFARLKLELEQRYEELIAKKNVVTGQDLLKILIDIIPGADTDLQRHSGELI